MAESQPHSTSAEPVFMLRNAFSTVLVEGLIRDRDNMPVLARLQRWHAPDDLVSLYPLAKHREPSDDFPTFLHLADGPVPRPASSLPPAGDAVLRTAVGNRLGQGRSGIVVEATASPDVSSGGGLPPLVMKVARQSRCQSVARETWFYDEMECLQGVVLPRFYGCFILKLDDGWTVPAWTEHVPQGLDEEDDVPAEFLHVSANDLQTPDFAAHPALTEMAKSRDLVVVLVLERVGPALDHETVKQFKHIREDLFAAYTELARLGVDMTLDMKSNSVLLAPQSPPGLPSLPSPFTKLTYNLRIIDLDKALKTDFVMLMLEAGIKEHLVWVLGGE